MRNSKNINTRIILLLFLILIGLKTTYSQDGIPKKPALETSVYDYAHLLSSIEKDTLEKNLIKYSDSTSTQIVVATVKTINGRNIALYATEWAHKWGIGQDGKDNGVFVLVAKNDRKLTIRTGYGVEHLLTDAYSRRIIEQVIKPEFKRGDYYRGLDRGTAYIFKVLNGEFKADPKEPQSDGEGLLVVFLIFFVIILIIILSNRNKGNNGGRYRRDSTGSILETIILSNRGRGGFSGGFGGSSGGFGGSSGGSGGFSGGFGGGGFGGGGASGGW